MKKIVIVSKVGSGARVRRFGLDGEINPSKKTLSTKLSNNLNEKFKDKNMDYEVDVDETFDSLQGLIKNGASLVLISPYIKKIIDTSNVPKDKYYMLSENEFNHGEVDDIINHLERFIY